MGDKNKRSKAATKKRKDAGSGEPHKIAWSKVNHGAPPIKNKPGWVERIVANKEDAAGKLGIKHRDL